MGGRQQRQRHHDDGAAAAVGGPYNLLRFCGQYAATAAPTMMLAPPLLNPSDFFTSPMV